MDKIAVLIPCYNEEKTIEKVIHDAIQSLPDATIYVYDNNSTDHTASLAQKAGAIVRHEYMQGKGNVIRRMFREINAECYIMIDGDDTYPLEFAQEMSHLVLTHNADMVIGDRLSSTYFVENKRPFHNLGNTIVRNSINRLFGCEVKDIMTGFRAFSYQFVKSFPVTSKGFEIETEMTIHSVFNNMQVENVIVTYRDRPVGSVSKLNTYSDGLKVLGIIFKLFRTYKPLRFFSILSILLTIIAGTFFIPILIEYFETGFVGRFPTLFVCGFVVLAAIQSFFSGMILENIIQKDRKDFEYMLQLISMKK